MNVIRKYGLNIWLSNMDFSHLSLQPPMYTQIEIRNHMATKDQNGENEEKGGEERSVKRRRIMKRLK